MRSKLLRNPPTHSFTTGKHKFPSLKSNLNHKPTKICEDKGKHTYRSISSKLKILIKSQIFRSKIQSIKNEEKRHTKKRSC